MIKIKLTLTLILLLIIEISFAQQTDFNLSDYKLPNIKRRTLELGLGMDDNFRTEKLPDAKTNNSSLGQSNQSFGDGGSNSFYSNFYIQYAYSMNTEHIQRNSTLSLNNYFRSSSYTNSDRTVDDDESENYQSNFTPRISYRMESRKYHNANSFFETDFSFNFNYDRSKNTSDSEERDGASYRNGEQKRIYRHLQLKLPLKIGKGRIEQVQDARHAVYLLNELSKINKIRADYQNEDILKLASFISQLKNKRFFDHRIRQKYEFMALDSFFVNNNFSRESDMDYFSTLSEFWIYGDRQKRLSGERFSFAIIPSYIHTLQSNEDSINTQDTYVKYDASKGVISSSSYSSEKNSLNAFAIKSGIEYVKEKPINLKWQNSISAYLYGGMVIAGLKNEYIEEETEENDIDILNPYFQMKYSQTFGYYPNTRTNFSFGYSADFSKIFENNDEDIMHFDAMGVRLSTFASAYYYISPQLRISGDWKLSYLKQKSDEFYVVDFDSPEMSYSFDRNFNQYLSSSYNESLITSEFRLKLTYSFF